MRKRGAYGSSPEESQHPAEERVALLRISRADGTAIPVGETPMLRALHHGETVVGETMVLPLPERIHWVSVNAAPIRLDGAIHGVIATLNRYHGTPRHAGADANHTFTWSLTTCARR